MFNHANSTWRDRVNPARMGRAVRAVALAGLALAGSGAAQAQIAATLSFDDVIQKSDQIFVATCEGKASNWRDGNIITTYKIRPKEFWKGGAPTGKDGTVEIDQVGGSVSAGPIHLGQHFTASVSMIPGEEMLLFTKTHKADPALKAAGQKDIFPEGQLQVVGMYQGRYSILTDAKSGTKHVLPVGMEAYGVVANDESLKRYLNLKSSQLQAARTSAEARRRKQGQSGGVSVDEILDELWKNLTPAERDALKRLGDQMGGDDPSAAAADPKPAPAGSGGDAPAKPRAKSVKSFETLDSLRERVMERLAQVEGENGKP